ncbi:MAG: Uma2 family endonuclease [Chromatiaceae bacterium]
MAYDRDTNLPLYARFQVPDVWIVDIAGRHLDIHREPDGTRYTHQFRDSDLSRVEVAAVPGPMLDLRGLFSDPVKGRQRGAKRWTRFARRRATQSTKV